METRLPECLLSSVRVLDLTNEKGYLFFSKMLGDLGAAVTRLEKPGTNRDYWWQAYNGKKQVIPFDIEKDDKDKLIELVKEADFLCESFAPGYLDRLGVGYQTLKTVNPRLIVVSLTSFGQQGPYRDLKASDLEIMALSGMLWGMGDPDRPPVRISLPQSYLMTSAEAAVGAMMALFQRELTGEGQWVDVSAQESVSGIMQGGIVHHAASGVIGTSHNRIGGNHGPLPGIKLGGGEITYTHTRHRQIWACRNGHVNYLVLSGMRGARNNSTIVKYMAQEEEVPAVLKDIIWETKDWGQTSPEEMEQIWDAFGSFFARHTKKELYAIALKERIELFPGNTVEDILSEEQLEARGFWQEGKLPDSGKNVRYPGPFARIQFGPTSAQLMKPEEGQGDLSLPFRGVKVLDFTWVYTGPWVTQWLALYGAEVIKVESSSHLDTGRRAGGLSFAFFNSGKKSLNLNLKHPEGRRLAERLVKWADVVTENFSPGTLARLGFGYEALVKLNPGIILMSASMFGQDGPHAAQPGLGQLLTSFAGFNHLTGWPDRLPVTAHGPYTDIVACRMVAATLFAALNFHKRTGRGCYIDLSQFEASLHFLAPLILEYQDTGRLLTRMGNHSLFCSPHNVYPCRGEDRWCALSVTSDPEWQAFLTVVDRPELKDERFDTFPLRKENEPELDEIIGRWTVQFAAPEVMDRLQQAGVMAGVVAHPESFLQDPQLNFRKHWVAVEHPELGTYEYSDAGFRLEKARPKVGPAPLFGEHNKDVATGILGLSEEEYEKHVKAGVFQ